MSCPASNLLSCAACVARMTVALASFLAVAAVGPSAGAAPPQYNLLVIQTDEHNFARWAAIAGIFPAIRR